MIMNHLKTAWRTMVKNKTYATINILGLTLGLVSCMLVFTVVIDDLSYDKFWRNGKNLYKASQTSIINGVEEQRSQTPVPLGTELIERFPEVEAYTRLQAKTIHFKLDQAADQSIRVDLLVADTTFVDMFDVELMEGNIHPFVAGQRSLLITESFRQKHFRDQDPVGKTLYPVNKTAFEDLVSKAQSAPYVIAAVIKDIPQNTHLRTEVLLLDRPASSHLAKGRSYLAQTMYYQLRPGTDVPKFTKKVNDWYTAHMEREPNSIRFSLQPIEDVYLHSDFDAEQNVKSNQTNLFIFGAVGILLLLIGCINFVNLSTAKAIHRLKETGIRKILGANRRALVQQYLTESLLFFTLATVGALTIYFLALPALEQFLGHGLTHTLQRGLPALILTLLAIWLLSVLTGSYPAWVMAGFKPSNTLRNKFYGGSLWSGERLRKVLVVVQFGIAIVVLVSLIVVKHQLAYINQKDLGYEMANLLYIHPIDWDQKNTTFKSELMKTPGITGAGTAMWHPKTKSLGRSGVDDPNNENERIYFDIDIVDLDFAQTLGLKLLKGRLSSADYGADRSSSTDTSVQSGDLTNVLLTEYTARLLGITELNVPFMSASGNLNPIGIVQDFHIESLHHAVSPIVIALANEYGYGGLYIRIEAGKEKQALAGIKATWDVVFPNRPLEISWVDEIVRQQYEAEQKQQALLTLFGTLMLALSCLGVFGLIVHAAEQRTKEIGIRKVLGASVSGIVAMFSKDFVKLILIAILIASPLAWWAMSKWLEEFAYKIEMRWWMFAVAGLMTVIVAIFTVASQAIKAAVANPVDSLRDE